MVPLKIRLSKNTNKAEYTISKFMENKLTEHLEEIQETATKKSRKKL